MIQATVQLLNGHVYLVATERELVQDQILPISYLQAIHTCSHCFLKGQICKILNNENKNLFLIGSIQLFNIRILLKYLTFYLKRMNRLTGSVTVDRVAGGQKYVSDLEFETLSRPHTPKRTATLGKILNV